jgi:hypothetical protein
MTTLNQSAPSTGFWGWFSRIESWLDNKGKGAWIAAMVLAFIFVWPLGLAILAYMIWSNKMSCSTSRRSCGHMRRSATSTGNTAFDAYKSETLQRLQDEQEQFEAFLQRLRDARDKTEFDQFMEDREKAVAATDHTEA